MKKYYYKVTHDSIKRGYNKTISVYSQFKNGHFVFIGEKHVNTAGYKGEAPTAVDVLHRERGHKTDGYNLISKNIVLIQLP